MGQSKSKVLEQRWAHSIKPVKGTRRLLEELIDMVAPFDPIPDIKPIPWGSFAHRHGSPIRSDPEHKAHSVVQLCSIQVSIVLLEEEVIESKEHPKQQNVEVGWKWMYCCKFFFCGDVPAALKQNFFRIQK